MIATGPGPQGEAAAKGMMAMMAAMDGSSGPKPGEGPSRQEREAGSYDLIFLGKTASGTRVQCVVTGDRDPGYGSTSKMIAETALGLLEDAAGVAGGFWTPGVALGERLIGRLEAHAGLTFAPSVA